MRRAWSILNLFPPGRKKSLEGVKLGGNFIRFAFGKSTGCRDTDRLVGVSTCARTGWKLED